MVLTQGVCVSLEFLEKVRRSGTLKTVRLGELRDAGLREQEGGDAVIFLRSDISTVQPAIPFLFSFFFSSPPRPRSSIKTPLPKIHHNSSPAAETECFYFSEDHKYTHNFLSILTFFWPSLSKQFRLLFPPDLVSPPPSPWVGRRLMKGRSRRSAAQTYHGVSLSFSLPFRREAGYKKFRAAASAATL